MRRAVLAEEVAGEVEGAAARFLFEAAGDDAVALAVAPGLETVVTRRGGCGKMGYAAEAVTGPGPERPARAERLSTFPARNITNQSV